MDVRIAVSIDSGLADAISHNNVTGRSRARKLMKEIQNALLLLGYSESGALWVSPYGREASLISTLSYRLTLVPGLRETCRAITAVRLSEDPLDILANISSMVDHPFDLRMQSGSKLFV